MNIPPQRRWPADARWCRFRDDGVNGTWIPPYSDGIGILEDFVPECC